jgi:hypothetical protein
VRHRVGSRPLSLPTWTMDAAGVRASW